MRSINNRVGIIKYFNSDRGYGFIQVRNFEDHFFHIDNISTDSPHKGDIVSFISKQGEKGKEAISISVSSKKNKDSSYDTPYYKGKSTSKEIQERRKETRNATGAVGFILGAAIDPSIGILSGIAGWMLGEDTKTQKIEVTSRCIKCGGIAKTETRRNGGLIGFQCPRCYHYWKTKYRHRK